MERATERRKTWPAMHGGTASAGGGGLRCGRPTVRTVTDDSESSARSRQLCVTTTWTRRRADATCDRLPVTPARCLPSVIDVGGHFSRRPQYNLMSFSLVAASRILLQHHMPLLMMIMTDDSRRMTLLTASSRVVFVPTETLERLSAIVLTDITAYRLLQEDTASLASLADTDGL